MIVIIKKVVKTLGPILLSALAIILSFIILQPMACWLDPTFNLLANRGIGKVAFVFLVIFQIFLLLVLQNKNFFDQFLETNIKFFKDKNFPKGFFSNFSIFFILHSCILFLVYLGGFANYDPNWGTWSLSLIFRIFFGFIVVFFLAWTEELIFRGTLYPYFLQNMTKIQSILFTSLIFMFVHNLKNPLALVTTDWQLGLGLFLLGVLLNINFCCTKKLYTSMGIHAGLVFVKVFLRRVPFIKFLPPEQLPFWLNKDLRMSHLIHILFIVVILIYVLKNRKKIFT